jgi:hypothetical protein
LIQNDWQLGFHALEGADKVNLNLGFGLLKGLVLIFRVTTVPETVPDWMPSPATQRNSRQLNHVKPQVRNLYLDLGFC